MLRKYNSRCANRIRAPRPRHSYQAHFVTTRVQADYVEIDLVKFGASVRNWLSMNDPGGVSENHNPSPMPYYDNGIG
jgi:hypothetical protein